MRVLLAFWLGQFLLCRTVLSISEDLALVFISYGCCSRLPQTAWLNTHLFSHSSGGWETQDQGSRVLLTEPARYPSIAVFEPDSGPVPHTKSAGALILDFPTSRAVRDLLFKPPSQRYFCKSVLKTLRHCIKLSYPIAGCNIETSK